MMNVYFIFLVYSQPVAKMNRGKSLNIQLFFNVLYMMPGNSLASAIMALPVPLVAAIRR
jgi:hypothetical protein